MDLTPVIEAVLVMYSDTICRRIKSRWASLGIKGNAEADSYILGSVKGAVVSRIFGSGQKAWIAEFGSGSLMEDSADNPYLNDYLQSPEFNQWRLHSSRLPIMGRSAGEYTDLDGVTHISSGKLAGFDLERDGWAVPQEPMHIMREEVTEALPEISEALSSAISVVIADEVSLLLTARIYL